MKDAIRPNTKAIVLSYPSNPTGKVMDQTRFKEIVGVADDHGLTVISDEIYNDYAYKPCPTILGTQPDRFILTASFSKTWAMTGFRVGYSLASAETSAKMLKILGLMITCVPDFIQRGAVKALECVEEVSRNSRVMKERIDATTAELEKIDALALIKPEGAIYAFPQARDPAFDSTAFAMEAPREEGGDHQPWDGVRRLSKMLQDLARPASGDPLRRRQEDRRTAQLRVAVLGASGGMGSFFARYFLEKGDTVRGSDPKARKGEQGSGGRRLASFSTNAEAVKGCDVTIIAVPIESTLRVANEVASKLKPGSILVEISSVKGETLPALMKLVGERVRLLSIHPLFGPALESMKGMKIAVIVGKKGGARGKEVALAERLFPGARLIPMSREEHDRTMAVVLSLTQLMNVVYAGTVSQFLSSDEFARVSTPNSSMQPRASGGHTRAGR